MSDLISRQDAIEEIRKSVSKSEAEDSICFNLGLGIAEKVVEALPSAEPKTGKWKKISSAIICECSECGRMVMTGDIESYKFCHGCGARMMNGGEEE